MTADADRSRVVVATSPTPRAARIGYALVAIAATGWGTWPLILRHAPMNASLQSLIVMTTLVLASLPIMLRGDRVSAKASLRHWLGVGWLGVADSLNIALFFEAYQRTTVAIAVLTHYLTPIFVALASPFVLRERMTLRAMMSVAISSFGLVLLLEPWRTDLSRSDVIGALLGSASAVFYASNVLVNKRLMHVFSASELMFFHGFVAIPFLWLLVPSGAFAATSTKALLVVLAGSLGPGAASGLSFVWGLRRIPASHASILTLLEPFVAVLSATLFLGQSVKLTPSFGGVLILIGAVVVVTGRTTTQPPAPST